MKCTIQKYNLKNIYVQDLNILTKLQLNGKHI